jgi:hypothetical protein
MSDRPDGQQPPAQRDADHDEDTLADHTVAVSQGDLAKEVKRAKRRKNTRKVLEVSGQAAAVVAENAADVAIGVISSLWP